MQKEYETILKSLEKYEQKCMFGFRISANTRIYIILFFDQLAKH